ncbi:DUF397 domain-containing protein [Streptomyces sp. NPDC001678]|uniref:DUF397 domain-containing protein n=1 Tax=Streptomyces sp. NPDC001678 TaxID=3364599 RepID=UPI003688E609
MPDLKWRKSSFSAGGAADECIELAAGADGIHLRESDTPTVVLSLSPRTLRALLRYSQTTD